jgi:hypothetical protein
MATTGINFFTQRIGATNQLAVFYDFKESGNNPIPSVSLGNSIYSGTIITNSLNNFYSKTGSGFFNSNSFIKINNSSGLNSSTWTISINYELSTGQNGILFSNYSSGSNINSGFCIGVNNSCQPYIEFFTNNGPTVIQSQNNWGTKNSIFVTKTPNNITIDYLNFNSKLLETEQFSINDNYFIFSDKCLIGGASGCPSYFSGNNFSGYIDNFIFFTPALLPYQKLGIFSGIYCDIAPPAQNITSITTQIITGYITGFIPIFTGTTGQINQFYNYLTGQCNNITATYQIIDLTGTIYDIGNTPLYQTKINYITGITGGISIEQTGYSQTFGMDSISYLKQVDTGDITELFYFPNSVNKTNINNTINFDRVLNQFVLTGNNFTTDQINFYINSAAQFGSGYSNGGTFYNPTVDLSGMFYVSGIYISGINYDSSDTNIIDYISGNRIYKDEQYFISGGLTGISGLGFSQSSIFLNGIKLQSGIDYYTLGLDFILKTNYITGFSGKFWTFPNDSAASFASGNYNNISLNKFARNTSIIYLNGARESLYTDFIELSKFSPLNNTNNFINNLNNIYNNNNTFIEFL